MTLSLFSQRGPTSGSVITDDDLAVQSEPQLPAGSDQSSDLSLPSTPEIPGYDTNVNNPITSPETSADDFQTSDQTTAAAPLHETADLPGGAPASEGTLETPSDTQP
jgi:hypothetical protein